MFKIRTPTKSKIQNSYFLKQNTFQTGRGGGHPTGLSNSYTANCLIHPSIHLVWSWFLTCFTSVINILTVGFHYTCKFDILIESKFLSLLM